MGMMDLKLKYKKGNIIGLNCNYSSEGQMIGEGDPCIILKTRPFSKEYFIEVIPNGQYVNDVYMWVPETKIDGLITDRQKLVDAISVMENQNKVFRDLGAHYKYSLEDEQTFNDREI